MGLSRGICGIIIVRPPPAQPHRMPAIMEELGQYGPRGVARPATLLEGRRYCRRLACSHYENFIVTSLFVPRRLRPHFYHIYAWCRWADDLADEAKPTEAMALLDWWEAELLACYEGKARHPVTVALAETIERFGLERRHFQALLSAFRQDQHAVRYATFDELLDYCRRSAVPVGRLVLALGGEDVQRCGSLADAICIGLQLVNFWQDVARDWNRGRRYLPEETLDRFGAHDAFATRRATPGFRQALESEVDRAESYLRQGLSLAEHVHAWLAGQVWLYVQGGLCVARRIRRQAFDVWSQRPRLTKWDRAILLSQALACRLFGVGQVSIGRRRLEQRKNVAASPANEGR